MSSHGQDGRATACSTGVSPVCGHGQDGRATGNTLRFADKEHCPHPPHPTLRRVVALIALGPGLGFVSAPVPASRKDIHHLLKIQEPVRLDLAWQVELFSRIGWKRPRSRSLQQA